MGEVLIRPFLLAAAALLLPASALALDPGDVVFTEFAIAPAAGPEWFEVYNPTASSVDLAGCVLSEDDNLFTIDALVIGSRDYAVLSRSDACAIYDDAGACVAQSDLVYGSLSLNNSGVEVMELRCADVLIDAVGYDYDEFEDDCLDAGSCSVGLNGLGQSADTNDDWAGSWCVPALEQLVYDEAGGTVRASPWAPTDCITGGPACGVGDVVVTEMMVDALASSDSREWFEIKVTTGSGCDLQGCQLWEGPDLEVPTDQVGGDDDDSAGDDDDESTACEEPIDGWRCHEVDAPGNTLAFASGEYALFGKGADLVASTPEEIPVDYRYSGLFFNNDDPTYLHLVCNDTVVESARYDWSLFQGDCPNDGCTLQLHASSEVPTANDEPTGWCVASDEDEYRHGDEVGDPFFGTPGAVGACLAREWPTEGEVVFSELMIGPISSSAEGAVSFPEWFELTSVTNRDVELEGCRVRRIRPAEADGDDDDDSAAPVDDIKEHQIGSDGLVPVLAAGASQVLVKSECIDGTEAPDTGICNTADRTDTVYGTLSFSNGDVTEELILECPDVTGGDPVIVDRTSYNQQRMANRAGHSMEFDVTVADPASVNDDFGLWCEASFQDCIDDAVTEDGDCNYGTPGSAGPCATGNVSVPPSGAGCRCDNIEARGGATGLGLLLLLGLLRRKKA